jgi:hypothetical protein
LTKKQDILKKIDKNLIIPESILEYLYAKLDKYKTLKRRETIHQKNLRLSLSETKKGIRGFTHIDRHLKKITHQINQSEIYLNSYNNTIDKTQLEILEIESENEKMESLLKTGNLEREQLITIQYINKLKKYEQLSNLKKYDVFISHSSEDKNSFVKPLANKLIELDVKVWFDEFELQIGDSLREKIDYGLSNSRFGVIVLSNSFFKRKWTKYELNGFVSREMNESKVILPIWHKVSKDEVINFSPTLADKVALNSSLNSISEIAENIKSILYK